jgi:hypothetical protein
MKKISYLEALLLKKISDSSAEIFTNCLPAHIYINAAPAGSDCIPVVKKFLALGFLDISQGFSSDSYSVNEVGKLELLKYYWKN